MTSFLLHFKRSMQEPVREFIKKLQKEFPHIPVKPVDERYTSKLASQAMVQMGLKKKDRQNKKIIDEVAATIILQEYLQQRGLA